MWPFNTKRGLPESNLKIPMPKREAPKERVIDMRMSGTISCRYCGAWAFLLPYSGMSFDDMVKFWEQFRRDHHHEEKEATNEVD